MTTETEQTKAQRFRDYLKANGPQTTQQLMAAFGMKWAQVWGACRPQVATGLLLFDADTGAYDFGRNPEDRPRQTPEERRAKVAAYEADPERKARKAEQRKARLAKRPISAEQRAVLRERKRASDRRCYEARNAKRRAERLAAGKIPKLRGSSMRLVQNKEARNRDHATRQAERADAAQVMRNREHGVVNRPKSMELESVEAFMARGGSIERLRNGQVSKASQFQRIEVRA